MASAFSFIFIGTTTATEIKSRLNIVDIFFQFPLHRDAIAQLLWDQCWWIESRPMERFVVHSRPMGHSKDRRKCDQDSWRNRSSAFSGISLSSSYSIQYQP